MRCSPSKRTVYTFSEVQEFLRKKTLVILFRYIELEREIPHRKIVEVGIKGNIQSIRQISNEQYVSLKYEQ